MTRGRPRTEPTTHRPPAGDEPDVLICEVRLKSGKFASSIEVPFPCTKAELETFAGSWFDFMLAGLKVGSEARRAKEAKS